MFANALRHNVTTKLSKQDKDKELIKVIKNKKREILDKLMRDSVVYVDNKAEDQIESIFQKV